MNMEVSIATATDLSRMEVDRAHREEIAAARAEVGRLTDELELARRDRATLRDRCTLLGEGNRRLSARLNDAQAETESAFWAIATLVEHGDRRYSTPQLDAAVARWYQARLADRDAVSSTPASTESDEQAESDRRDAGGHLAEPDGHDDECPHESWNHVGYGSRQCTVCGIHLPPAGHRRGYR